MEWETDGDTVTGSGRIDEDDRKGTAAAGRSLSTDAALAISSSLLPRASFAMAVPKDEGDRSFGGCLPGAWTPVHPFLFVKVFA